MLTAYIRTVSDSYSRPTTRNTDTFGYNDLGEVVFSRRGAEGAEDAYAYDSIGNQTNFVANATTNSYTHNALNQIETATIPQFYILNSPFSISNDLSGTLQGAGGVGGLLAVSINTNFYFPAYDNNGNITKYIDESGNIVAAYEYDAFGRTISQSAPSPTSFATASRRNTTIPKSVSTTTATDSTRRRTCAG